MKGVFIDIVEELDEKKLKEKLKKGEFSYVISTTINGEKVLAIFSKRVGKYLALYLDILKECQPTVDQCIDILAGYLSFLKTKMRHIINELDELKEKLEDAMMMEEWEYEEKGESEEEDEYDYTLLELED